MSSNEFAYYDTLARQIEVGNTSPPPITSAPESKLVKSIDWGSYLAGAGTNQTQQISVYFTDSDIGSKTLDGIRVTPNDWTEYETTQVREALSVIENYADVKFVTVQSAEQADLTFIIDDYAIQYGMLGLFMPPDASVNSGHGVFFRNGKGWDEDGAGGLEPGGTGFTTILHETLHALGLAHPHDTGGTSEIIQGFSGSVYSDMADYDLNQSVFTVMSLVDGWASGPLGVSTDTTSGQVASPGPIDIALLQSVYGEAQLGAGDDVYKLGALDFTTIWDVAGVDTLSAAHLSNNAVINLNAAHVTYNYGGGGYVSYVNGTIGGVNLAQGTVIENAVGGLGNDIITGNFAHNQLEGGGGADTFIINLDGGQDVVVDFEVGIDQITLPKSIFANWVDLKKVMRNVGADVLIDLGSDNSVTLRNNTVDDLTPTDFGLSATVQGKYVPARSFSQGFSQSVGSYSVEAAQMQLQTNSEASLEALNASQQFVQQPSYRVNVQHFVHQGGIEVHETTLSKLSISEDALDVKILAPMPLRAPSALTTATVQSTEHIALEVPAPAKGTELDLTLMILVLVKCLPGFGF